MESRPTVPDLVDSLAGLLASGVPSEGARAAARAYVHDAGIEQIVHDLALAERILLAGEGFHSVERFFVDGSDEQRFLVELIARTRAAAGS